MFSTISIATLVLLVSRVAAIPRATTYSPGNAYGGSYQKPSKPSAGKAGLAFPKNSPCTSQFTSPKITWGYNWEAVSDGLPSRISEFVPTCRGGKNAALCDSMTDLSGVKYIFGPNEPDMTDQDIFEPLGTYSKAVAFWKTKMEPRAGKFKLGAPSVSCSEKPGEGLDWLMGFMKACSDCTIDFLNIHWHWYSPDTAQGYYQKFTAHIMNVHKQYPGKPIWVAEFSAQKGTVQDIANFLKMAMAWMDKQDYVFRYAYYMAAIGSGSDGTMANSAQSLNPVGVAYNS